MSIPKDIDKIGFKLFDDGPPTRRKSSQPNGSSLIVRSNASFQLPVKAALALPAPRRSRSVEKAVEKPIKVALNIDDKAVPWESDEDEGPVGPVQRNASAQPIIKKVCF